MKKMSGVCKYNTYKAISTALTMGTPIVTLCSCSDMFVHRSETALSAAGIFAMLLSLLFVKDKIAENFKVPSAFVIALVTLVIMVMIRQIMDTVITVSLVTCVMTGVDELTFKRMYKQLEKLLPENAEAYKHFGFLCARSKTIEGE